MVQLEAIYGPSTTQLGRQHTPRVPLPPLSLSREVERRLCTAMLYLRPQAGLDCLCVISVIRVTAALSSFLSTTPVVKYSATHAPDSGRGTCRRGRITPRSHRPCFITPRRPIPACSHEGRCSVRRRAMPSSRLSLRLGQLPHDVLAELAARLCSDSPALQATAEECMAAHAAPLSHELVERVLLSPDLVPSILGPLEAKDGAAAAVCSQWLVGWKTTNEPPWPRRRLKQVPLDFPEELLLDDDGDGLFWTAATPDGRLALASRSGAANPRPQHACPADGGLRERWLDRDQR